PRSYHPRPTPRTTPVDQAPPGREKRSREGRHPLTLSGNRPLILVKRIRARLCSPSRVAAMAPSAVGPYRFLERLGAGANGDVCLAEDTRLRRRVALKKLQGTAGADTAQ